MNMVSIRKDFGDGPVWGTVLEPHMKVGAYSEMIMPCRSVATLDELSVKEETELWALGARRGRLILENPKYHAIGLFINDGQGSGQTVAHAHLHVVASERDATCPDFSRAFSEVRLIFARSTEVNMPVAGLRIEAGLNDVAGALRSARQNLRAQNGDITSFSTFSQNPIGRNDFSAPQKWQVEGWDSAHISNLTLSNMLRFLSGARATPDNTHAPRYDGFEEIAVVRPIGL